MTLYLKLKNRALELLADTSFHGPSKILAAKNLVHKLIWFVLVLVACCYCFLSVTNLVLEFISFPVVTNTDLVFGSRPEFPAVAICQHDKGSLNATFNSQEIEYTDSFREVNVSYGPHTVSCSEFNSGNFFKEYF